LCFFFALGRCNLFREDGRFAHRRSMRVLRSGSCFALCISPQG
jgi:hypothetical protein